MTNSKKWYLLLSATGLTFNFLAKGHRQKSSIGYVRVQHRGGIMALVTKGEKIIRDHHEELHKCLMQTESRLRATGLCVVSERAVTWAAGHVESGPSVIQPAHEPSLCPRGLPPVLRSPRACRGLRGPPRCSRAGLGPLLSSRLRPSSHSHDSPRSRPGSLRLLSVERKE